MKNTGSVAILYQAAPAPARNGAVKPMKSGGYSDSGADIACALRGKNVEVISPVEAPDISKNFDWVFPDTYEGIEAACEKGAEILWLNTVLYKGHPIEKFLAKGISVVGQNPENVDLFDDKLFTSDLLRKNNLPVPNSLRINPADVGNLVINFNYPVVAKPVLGRGSQGVQVAKSREELQKILQEMLSSGIYGDAVYVEEFLPGEEITVTVMPPGNYIINDEKIPKNSHWCLPIVRRFNHEKGVAPYSGNVAVIHNSAVLSNEEENSDKMRLVRSQCEMAAKLVGAKAPIRIDCRADASGDFFLFDVNMKPNMTGFSRPGREDQDSLTALAARKIGWSYGDLVVNILHQNWKL